MVGGIARGAGAAMLNLVVICAGEPPAAQDGPQGPPDNLQAGAYRSVVHEMWRASAAFRRQCKALADAPELIVRIRGESRPSFSGVRARTEISINRGRGSVADIVLMSPADTVELIAHEIEHVVEVLEGIRLTEQGCNGSSMGHARESCRAVEAGRHVAAEVQAARGRGRSGHASWRPRPWQIHGDRDRRRVEDTHEELLASLLTPYSLPWPTVRLTGT